MFVVTLLTASGTSSDDEPESSRSIPASVNAASGSRTWFILSAPSENSLLTYGVMISTQTSVSVTCVMME